MQLLNMHHKNIEYTSEDIDWLIECFVFYAVSAIFKPCKHTSHETKKKMNIHHSQDIGTYITKYTRHIRIHDIC